MFVERYARLVYWAIQRRLALSGFRGEEAEIEDIFQEVFVAILEGAKLRQLKEPRFLAGWLAMIAANKTSDYMRKKLLPAKKIVLDNLVDDDAAERQMLGNDIVEVIKTVIASLASRERVVLSLNLLEEKSHKQIAQMLAMPLNTVSTIVSRAREQLKNELKKRGIKNF